MTTEKVINILKGIKDGTACLMPNMPEDGEKAIDIAIKAVEQSEPHEIGYDDCANALLKMWMDNVLTDEEYYRIAGKLNVKWGKTELPESYKRVTE